MQERSTASRWVPAAFAVISALAVGLWAYDLGLSRGLAAQLPPPANGVYPWAYYRPWGFGPIFPLFFLAFWFFVVRFAFRGPFRGGWRGGPGYGGWGSGYPDRLADVPPAFDEWHRRAHAADRDRSPDTGKAESGG
jgi:hypothetical protein